MIKIGTIILSLTLCSAVYAEATPGRSCSTRDLNGDWVSYQNAVTVAPHTGVCRYTITDGSVNGTCEFSTGFEGPLTGTVTVAKDCSAELVMNFTPAPVVSSFHIQVHKDRLSFAGRWENNFGVLGTTTGIKR